MAGAAFLASSPGRAVPPGSDGAGYEALNPARLIDTRPASQEGPFNTPWAEGVVRQVQVTGVGGVPASNVVAVVLNVTSVNPTADFSWLTINPTGAVANNTAAHNFGKASFSTEILNDVVVAKVGTGGQIDIVNVHGSVDLVIDVVGYYGSDGGAGYEALNPERLIDTRGASQVGPFGSPWAEGAARQVQVTGVGGVPASGVVAVVLNVTSVNPSADFSWLTINPTGAVANNTAAHNFGKASFSTEILNDVVVAKVGTGGQIDILNAHGSVDLVIDIVGFFTSEGGGARYEPLNPERLIDSRAALQVGPFGSPWTAGVARQVQVTGVGGVPAANVVAVVLNVTSVNPTADFSWLTINPTGAVPNLTAAHNFGTAAQATEILNDVVVAKVGTGGQIDIVNEHGSVDLVIDVVGYYSSTVARVEGGVIDRVLFQPVEDITVCAIEETTAATLCALTDAEGMYHIDGIAPGIYEIRFTDSAGLHMTECYQDSRCITPDLITLAGGDVVRDIGAVLTPTGSVSGWVSDAVSGLGIEGIDACVRSLSITASHCAQTSSTGHYTITGIPPQDYAGDYEAEFSDPAGDYFSECYEDDRDCGAAETLVILPGSSTFGIDADLDPGGNIIGMVTAAVSSNPVDDIFVCAEHTVTSDKTCVSTEADGTYVIGLLELGDYIVSFTDFTGVFDSQCYANDPECTLSTSVEVIHGDVSGIDAALIAPGGIAGTVTDGITADPVADIRVCATTAAYTGCTDSIADGSYEIQDLPAGDYEVKFEDFANFYFTECYQDDGGCDSPTPVTVQQLTTTTDIDASLDSGGSIAGTVTDSLTNAPIEGIDVCTDDFANSIVLACVATGSDGSYLVDGAPDGQYKVRFTDSNELYFFQCYQNDNGCNSPTAVPVVDGAFVTGIDVALDPSGSIEGTVTNSATAAPIEGIEVCASIGVFHCADTAPDGTYRIGFLTPGNYQVQFQDPNGVFFPECYDSNLGCASPTYVQVLAGVASTNIDATLDPTGAIDGTVTASDTGDPIEGVMICGSNTTGAGFECTTTEADGTYRLPELNAGDYRVEFRPIGYTFECYDGSYKCNPPTLVTVVAGALTTGIDADLDPTGSISGTVIGSDTGLPIEGHQVCATIDAFNCVATAADGTYFIGELVPGDYKVEFRGDATYARECYPNSPDCFPEIRVTVTARITTTGIDADLDPRP